MNDDEPSLNMTSSPSHPNAHRTKPTFISTFNLNGTLPSSDDIQKWLGEGFSQRNSDWPNNVSASSADLVILSLQECPTRPCIMRIATTLTGSGSAPAAVASSIDNASPLVSHVGLSGPVVDICYESDNDACSSNDNQDETLFLQAIQKALSPEHSLVADVSMGNACGTTSSSTDNEGEDIQWYGYVRLLIFARGTTWVNNLRSTCMGIVVPVGSKLDRKARATVLSSDSRLCYYPRGSPDKGAIACALPTLGLIIVAAHLAGTNKYGVPENYFDTIRHTQLETISSVLDDALSEEKDVSDWNRVIVGDLNFRTEVYSDAEDKKRGGRDWSAVADILQRNSERRSDDVMTKYSEGIKRLFRNHDRLIKYLSQGPSCLGRDLELQSLPSIMKDSVDLIEKAHNNFAKVAILPTFPLNIEFDQDLANKKKSRTYKDKRTPSWTDRILVNRKLLFQTTKAHDDGGGGDDEKGDVLSLIESCPDITTSDHCPVRSYITLCLLVEE